MLNIIFLFFITSFISCDDSEYYKTFDYKTMSFKELTSKSDFCVRKISQTDDKIEMEVFFDFNKIKRTFIKKDGYWYSKYKFEMFDMPIIKDKPGVIHECEYYIYPTHIIFTSYEFIIFIDLNKEEIKVYDGIENNDIKNLDFNKFQDKLYYVSSFYMLDSVLYERVQKYRNSNFTGENTRDHGDYYVDLDFFYLLDIENYSHNPGIKPIYDSNSEE